MMTSRVARSAASWSVSVAGIVASLVVAASIARGAPVPPDKPCLLLTDAEITTAIGAPGKSHEGQKAITKGSAKGETMRTCSWAAANGGGAVNLSLVKVADLEAAKNAFRPQMQQTMQAL